MVQRKKSEIIIRDLRKKEKFVVDDAYLNGYAKLCGPNATLVYLCLCRHADYHTQECFPSVELMAEKVGVSRYSIMRGVKSLSEWNIILKEKTRHPQNNKWINNSYTLLDKSMWKTKPGSSQPLGVHVANQSKIHVAHSDSKVTHTEKVTHIVASRADKEEFNFQAELLKMKEGDRKDLKIIALYWKKKGWVFENRDQFNAALTRELRAAKQLKGYSGDQIAKAIGYCTREYPNIYTLETIHKRITDIANKKNE